MVTSPTAMPMGDFVQQVRGDCDGVLDPSDMGRFLAATRIKKYAAWGLKEWFPLNIEGMYRLVQANRRGN